jgi:hypothetical protein
MSDMLEKRSCTKPTWHGEHNYSWAEDTVLTTYTCPGYPLPEDPPIVSDEAEPESERMFRAFDRGVKLGRKQAIEQVYEALCDAGLGEHGTAIQAISKLMEEAEIKA